jgi:4,5-DOPA dioxygenase extradiol
MPVLLLGHGSPMNAIEDNAFSRAFKKLGASLPRPKAILSVSAHWFVDGTYLTGNAKPKTIHDFGGFPEKLFKMQYPAPGDPELAEKVLGLLGRNTASLSQDWGLDHGTWSVLLHLFPKADIPVIQLSIDENLDPARHLELGRALAPLRDEGILVMGSGNITHNLGYAMMSYQNGDDTTPAWAKNFDAAVEKTVTKPDVDSLARIINSKDGEMSHPTLDHYLPLIYAAGAANKEDKVSFPVSGFDMGSLSMRAVLWG